MELLFLLEDAPLRAEGKGALVKWLSKLMRKYDIKDMRQPVECVYVYVCVCQSLTMDLFEYSATHEIKKSVCIETGPVNWHCVLKHKQVSGHYDKWNMNTITHAY
jgi:hypothetical protein